MAQDRFISFEGKRPKKKEVESVTRHYFDEAAETIEWKGKSLIVKLIGKNSFPFADLEPDLMPNLRSDGRWIEVCTVGSLDIITRLQDDYTCHLADGLAEIFARYWKGEVDSG